MSGLDLVRYTHKRAGGLFEVATEIHAEIYSEPLFENHPFFSESAFRQRYEMALEQPRLNSWWRESEGRKLATFTATHSDLKWVGGTP
jgi:hypothetical protein